MARDLLVGAPMAMTRALSPDLVTLASLHGALDNILEIEELFAQIGSVPSADRLGALAAELRVMLVALLRADRR